VQQRGQPRPFDRFEPDPLAVELALQHGELVAQRQDLDVLVAVGEAAATAARTRS
jgi:hypothetical protein